MKKYLLLVLLVLCPLNAQAYSIIDVEYTGAIRERIDTCGYGCGYVSSTSYTSNLLFAGGPVANNSVGYAQQFTVDKGTNIDYLLVTAHIPSYLVPDGQIASNKFFFKLYTGTSDIYHGDPSLPYPNANTSKLVSPMYVETSTYDVYFPELDLTHTFNQDGYYEDVPIPFDITLKPGTYWIAQERYRDNTFNSEGPQHRVDSISVKFAKLHNPEPGTLLLMGGGLLGAFVRRRRMSKVAKKSA